MSRVIKRICLTLFICIVLLGAAAVGLVGFCLPYRQAENTMPASGNMMLTQLEDGTTRITWPRGVNAQYHVLEVIAGQPAEQVIYSTTVMHETSCILPRLPETEEVTIRVRSARNFRFLFDKEDRVRYGGQTMEITGIFAPPAIDDLSWTPDAEAKTVDVRFRVPEGSSVRMYYVESDGTRWQMPMVTDSQLTLQFGENHTFPIPAAGQTHCFAFDVSCQGAGYTYQGAESGRFTVGREDLLGTQLRLGYVGEGNNVFTFFWNETKGERYELQRYDAAAEQWTTVCTVDREEPRIYTTGHLERYSDFRYRVVALGGQTLPGSEFSAHPAEAQVSTGASVIYATIWPIQDLDVYDNPDRKKVLGTVPGAKACCVLDVENGMFRIRHEDGYGWIDSNYCMINLPDMIGDLCLYDIVNSYDALYMAHEYELPSVTGQVIVGYEQIRAEQRFLVPLLYPAALKLEKAAFDALEQGYQLKIYDSFRPQKATLALYEQTEALAAVPIPGDTYTGKKLEDLPKPAEGEALTYEQLMTDMGRYTLNYFLAAGGSRHNQGIALDLTLVSLDSGEELQMQTSMHDLSWYSEKKRNNENADILARIMEGAGFGGIVSEWWHYQDDQAMDELQPEYLWSGVTPEGWMADDRGWRYRRANGEYWTDCREYIDGVLFDFDQNGYAQQE